MTHHLDQTGALCTHHVPASSEAVLTLALLGTAIPSFHHDIASKLQSLIMTLDEIAERTGATEVRSLVTTAEDTIHELSQLLAANRLLARAARRQRHPVSKLIGLAAERSGVRVQGAVPVVDVEIGLLTATHALMLILDLAAGPVQLGRSVDMAIIPDESSLALEITGPPAALQPLPPNYSEVMAVASFAFARQAGQLRCGPGRFTIRLPLAT